MTNTLEKLKKASLFSTLSLEELNSLSKHFDLQRFENKAKIVREGDISEDFFIIQSGFVDVTRTGSTHEIFLATLGPGECFGEAALFQDVKRTANVEAHGSLELLIIKRSAFRSFLDGYPVAANRILLQMIQQLFNRLSKTSSELQFLRRDTLNQDDIDKLVYYLDGV